MNIQLVNFDFSFLELSWEWLNDTEIKKLTNTSSFSKESQIQWYKNINENTNYKIWGIDYNDKHVGVCGLKNITEIDCEFWGYIGEKAYWGLGIGSYFLKYLIEYSKTEKFKSIWLTVRHDNIRAIKLYLKFGFIIEADDNINLLKMRLML